MIECKACLKVSYSDINPLRTKLDLSYLKTLYALVIKMDKLILYTEIIAVCFEIY